MQALQALQGEEVEMVSQQQSIALVKNMIRTSVSLSLAEWTVD